MDTAHQAASVLSPVPVSDAADHPAGPVLLPSARQYTTLHVVLIKPTKYDDDGYVMRFWKGVLPSNTLNVLHGLTLDVARRRALGDVAIQVDTFDETTEAVPVQRILRWARRPATKLVVCLVGVQTNQFPRALDLGRAFRAKNVTVLMGGFHTSGTVNMLSADEPDIQTLIQESIVVVSGEVEGQWDGILADVLNDQAKPLYSFAQDLKSLVDIEHAPLPVVSPQTMKHFARSSFGTVETSRGCPFTCSFCTIINVQGRTMRERSPEAIVELVRTNHRRHGIDFYFFTDDNFARKKHWRETFEALIRLRVEEQIKITFMMQVDLAKKPKDFMRLAAAAGCSQVFVGMESVNPQNLKAEGKGQNKVEAYRDIIREWHDAGVVVHAGYIIGLPFDTAEQIPEDIRFLMETVQPDQASFFMLTPLPGSQDHAAMKRDSVWMDPDFNKRDSFHATIEHPHMTADQWTAAYRNAWRAFYSKESLISILSRWRHNPTVYWNLFFLYLWYKGAALIEGEHPMIAGFFRLKDRLSRRPGFAVDPWPVHAWKRLREILAWIWAWAGLLKEMQEVWLATRPRSERERLVIAELERLQGEIWQTLKIPDWRAAYADLKTALPSKARALLDPFEELTGTLLLGPKDLDRFLARWRHLERGIAKAARSAAPAAALGSHSHAALSAATLRKVQEWRTAYAGFRAQLPLRIHLTYAQFDAISRRVTDAPEEARRIWGQAWASLRTGRLWAIRPQRLTWAALAELVAVAAFARQLFASTEMI